ncbi:AmmeMemoRadiSam system protein B [Sulfuricurvum sp.]|uniref:AmmeMemoRadiSam system protein B n=1 Tax=Sulfuricurvum sp. TaxID=2025608 RepID=UPI002E37C1A2|nr:AmmeMemoRadiSam system protein B [Sulfuricurvum sp.]HEX5330770.1 AmmeMemoRadiSam system protein B [Sulfuricurvum sp.]
MKNRMMSVAGSFYPAKADDIEKMIERFNAILESHHDALQHYNTLHGNAFIVPHAGWVYSGFTANIAYRILSTQNFKTVVVIGPSHRVGFEGVSIADLERYQTPLGELAIDTLLVKELVERFTIPYFPDAHHEHSTEVQMPLIKHYCSDVNIVELVYSNTQPESVEPIISFCLNRRDTAVIISTDLSHYYSQSEAKRHDAICLDAIQTINLSEIHQGCEACGMIGVEAMLMVAKSNHLQSTILDYRTSADASGDTSRVVGYVSALFSF